MSKVVVIGFPGDPKLYLADVDLGTITELKDIKGPLAEANRLRASGGVMRNDVEFAVTISSAPASSAGVFDA